MALFTTLDAIRYLSIAVGGAEMVVVSQSKHSLSVFN